MATPEAKTRFSAVGFEVVGSTPTEFCALIERGLKKWQNLFKDGSLSAD